MTERDVQAEPAWTSWLDFDEVAIPMVLHTSQTLDELGETLLRLRKLGCLEFGQDAAGALLFRVRSDEPARVRALLDDMAQARHN